MKHCNTTPIQGPSLSLQVRETSSSKGRASRSATSICSVCKSLFAKRRYFREHLETVGCGGSELFPCNVCGKTLSKSATLKAHQEIHDGTQKTYSCKTCKAEFAWKTSLFRHLKEKPNCKPKLSKNLIRMCSVCQSLFAKRKDFMEHIEAVGCGGSERFPCNVCGKTLSSSGNHSTHLKVHNDVGEKYVCDTCNAEFTLKSYLKGHLMKKSNCERKHPTGVCSICKCSFARRKDFRRHARRMGCGGIELFPCNICGKSFALNYIKKHQRTHDIVRQKFICYYCKTEVFSRTSIISHLRRSLSCQQNRTKGIKSGGRIPQFSFTKKDFKQLIETAEGRRERFPCNLCNKTFSKLCYLKKHQVIHSSIRQKYFCHNCNAEFVCRSGLIAHFRKESNCKFKRSNGVCRFCSVCKSLFTKREDFRQHVVTVGCGGNERFPCNICGKSVGTPNILRKHQKIHDEARKKHVCDICNARFTWKSDLHYHCSVRHNRKGKRFKLSGKYTCHFCDSSFRKRWDIKNHFRRVQCANARVKVEDQSVSPLRDYLSMVSGNYRFSAPSHSSTLVQSGGSPLTSSHDNSFRVYVFKNTNSIDFETFVSSKVDEIKKTLNAEMEYHCNNVVKTEFETESVECIQIEGKSEKEVLETFGMHRSQFIPISNPLDIDNSVTRMVKEVMYNYQRHNIIL